MKRILLVITALGFMAATASAQKPGENQDKMNHSRHQKGKMGKELNLTDQQKAQTKTIKEDYRKKMEALDKQDNISVKEMRSRKAKLQAEQKAKMQTVLTTEQKAKMEQMKTNRKAKSEEMFGKRMEKMKTEVGITEAQANQLKAQHEGMQTKMKAIKENDAISMEQKKQQMMALKNEAKEQHKKIFTEDQLKKMKDMKKTKGMKENKELKKNRPEKTETK